MIHSTLESTLRLIESADIEFYRNGRNLDENERRMISDGHTWVVSFVNSLSKSEQTDVGRAFFPIDRNHYLGLQISEWFGKEKRELRASLGREPSDEEVLLDCAAHRNSERFKLCYVLEHPEKVILMGDLYNKFKYMVDLFLADGERLHPQNFPYRDRIPIRDV